MASGSGKPPRPGQADIDQALWRLITARIRPLKAREQAALPVAAPDKTHQSTQSATPPSASLSALKTLAPQWSSVPKARSGAQPPRGKAAMDHRTYGRFVQGQMPIEARLDLHGMTGPVARTAVHSFIKTGWQAGRRCVLVITGKGRASTPDRPDGGGILQQSLSHWLAEPDIAPLVLDCHPAQPRHGGSGAFYILIRRRRDFGNGADP